MKKLQVSLILANSKIISTTSCHFLDGKMFVYIAFKDGYNKTLIIEPEFLDNKIEHSRKQPVESYVELMALYKVWAYRIIFNEPGVFYRLVNEQIEFDLNGIVD